MWSYKCAFLFQCKTIWKMHFGQTWYVKCFNMKKTRIHLIVKWAFNKQFYIDITILCTAYMWYCFYVYVRFHVVCIHLIRKYTKSSGLILFTENKPTWHKNVLYQKVLYMWALFIWYQYMKYTFTYGVIHLHNKCTIYIKMCDKINLIISIDYLKLVFRK